jgi:large subunit ribosomal protein L3
MLSGIIGKKLGASQIFFEDGSRISVTVIEAGPCPILQRKVSQKDGYSAIQLGFNLCREKNLNKPRLGHLKKTETPALKLIREFRVTEKDLETLGDKKEILATDVFKEGDFVDVTGLTKGRGYTGVMKRHNFSGAPASHGAHEFHRHGGSIGQHTWPARVYKNKKMAGHYGNERVTTQNLKLVKVEAEKNLLFVQGSVPGCANGFVVLKKAVKK